MLYKFNGLESKSVLVQSYIDSQEKQQELYRRTLIIIVISQIFAGIGLTAGITVGALLARDIAGAGSMSGIPVVLFTIGSAGAALFVGWISQNFGRRLGLVIGFFIAGIGAIGVVISAVINSLLLLFIALFVYGAGTATNLQARYAGTDLANNVQRGKAVSIAMVSTTLGAVTGPNLVSIMGKIAIKFGIPALAGPFMLAAVAFISSGLVLMVLLRPDPLIIAKAIEDITKREGLSSNEGISTTTVMNKWGVILGAIIMVVTQIVMISIMTMTPIQMQSYGYSLSDIGLVMGIHIGALYLPSLITGIVVDRLGRNIMAITSGIILLIAGILASRLSNGTIILLAFSLALLGLGWNIGLISGTALIVDSTVPINRAKVQGLIDVLVALIGAVGGAISGLVVIGFGYSILSIAAGILALVIVPIVLFLQYRIRVNSMYK